MTNASTRLLILRAAEKLFAERGVDAVSLREVSVAAEQANHAAAQYHFGSKEGLLDAIIERHSVAIQNGWQATLDHYATTKPPSLRTLLGLLVRPIVAKLDDADGGETYLLLAAQLVAHPRYPLMERPTALGPGAMRLSGAIVERVDVPPTLLPARMARVAGTLYYSIAAYIRSGDKSPEGRALFVEDLIDCLLALVQAGVSSAARALLEQDTSEPSKPARRARRS